MTSEVTLKATQRNQTRQEAHHLHTDANKHQQLFSQLGKFYAALSADIIAAHD